MAKGDSTALQRLEPFDRIHSVDERQEFFDALGGPIVEELVLEHGLRCEVVVKRPLRHAEAIAQRGDRYRAYPARREQLESGIEVVGLSERVAGDQLTS
jgi:hypothetical protein